MYKVSIVKYWNIILRRRRKNFRSFLLKYSQNWGLGHSFGYVLGDTDKSNSADVAISIALKARNFFHLFLQISPWRSKMVHDVRYTYSFLFYTKLRPRPKKFRLFLLKYRQNWSLGHSLRNVLGDVDKSKSTDETITIAPTAQNFFHIFLQKCYLLSEISGKASLSWFSLTGYSKFKLSFMYYKMVHDVW